MLLAPGRVNLAVIQQRLLETVRYRLSNGDFTERGLARVVGISQPHIHNVLKGVRVLSPDLSDVLSAGLDLSLIELFGEEELGEALLAKQASRLGTQAIPILKGRIGPGDPFPTLQSITQWVVAADPELRSLRRPAFVSLGADPAISFAWVSHRYGLLDFDEAGRATPSLPSWFAVRWRGAGYLRQVRVAGQQMEVLGQRVLGAQSDPETIDIGGGALLQTVRAKLVWVGPDPTASGWLAHRGVWLPRTARS